MKKLFFYEIDPQYIDYLSQFSEHLFHNAKKQQKYSRKYIGILFEINGMKYFAPLSSYKEKHSKLSESLDLIKIGNMAVLNLNNIFPVPEGVYKLKDPATEQNQQYRVLLNNEYRIIKQKADLIIKNAELIYRYKITNTGKLKLRQRCNDFQLLEKKCKEWLLKV